MTRKTVALFILVGGLLSAFLIVYLAAPSRDDRTPLTFSAGEGVDSAFAFEENKTTRSTDTNLTESVVQRYGEEILKLNPAGSGTGGIVVPPEGTVESLIADVLEQPLTFATYAARDLKTIPLDGKEGLARYFVTLAQIQTDRFGGVRDDLLAAVAQFVSYGTTDSLEANRDAMTSYVGDLLAVPVPAPLTSFHLGLINLWQKRAALANLVLKSGDDPLKVVAAMDSLETTVREEDELLLLLASRMKNLNL